MKVGQTEKGREDNTGSCNLEAQSLGNCMWCGVARERLCMPGEVEEMKQRVSAAARR